MVQTNELRAAILRKGLTQSKVAKAIGISDKTFSDRMKKKVFGSDEIEKMIDLLEIENPMFVFFNRQVILKVTNKKANQRNANKKHLRYYI